MTTNTLTPERRVELLEKAVASSIELIGIMKQQVELTHQLHQALEYKLEQAKKAVTK